MNKKLLKKENELALKRRLKELEENNIFLLEKLKMASLDGDLKENADWLLIKEKVESRQREIALLKKKILLAQTTNNSNNFFITYLLLETDEKKSIELT